ncbi:MAG: arsenic resistance protein [Actinomycetota bacterium]|nr:arsenic resistance protein [Actinomycetota bacterium]
MSSATHSPALRALAGLPKHLSVLIPLSMALGLGVGIVADLSPLKSLILPVTMLMVYPMLVNFRLSETFSLKDGKAVGIAMAMNFIAAPAIAWGLAKLFFGGDPGLFVGMVLIGLFPTSGMTISWTGLAKGNVAAAVKMTVIGLLAASVLAPAYLYVLAGAVVDVDVIGVARDVLLVVFVPMVAAVATRTLLVRRVGQQAFRQRIAPAFPGLSTVGVLAIVFLAIGLKAKMIAMNPGLLLRIAAPLVLFYLVAFAVSTIAGRLALGRADAVAAVYGSVMRNLSIALGIAIASFGPEAALVLAGAYIVQVQAAAWYVRVADRVFGPHVHLAEDSGAAAPASA